MMNCVRFYPKDKNILVAGAGDATSGQDLPVGFEGERRTDADL